MSLRVLDDERPGYALLEFDPTPDALRLSLSVRSQLQGGAYLGPSGTWQKQPHYFSADRAATADGVIRYRVGPEVVNFMLEFDQVEIESDDRSLKASGEWENAVPDFEHRTGHSIYREAKISGVAQDEDREPRRQKVIPTPKAPEPAAPPAPRAAEPRPAPFPPDKGWPRAWLIGLPLLILLLAIAGLMLVPGWRCRILGTCPQEGGLLAEALACAAPKLATQPCEAAACFARYRASTPPAEQAQEAIWGATTAERACQMQKDAAANKEKDEQARRQREDETKKREEAAKKREDELRKQEDELRRQREEQARQEAERKQREDVARKQREDEARRQGEEQARRQREEQARRQAEEDARRRVEEEARRREQDQAGPRVPPSFDCTTDRRPAEQAICGNNELSRLDNDMASAYGDARRRLSGGQRDALQSDQRDWLKRRDDCQSDEQCLRDLYQERVQKLQGWGF